MPRSIPISIVKSMKPWPPTEKTNIWWWRYLGSQVIIYPDDEFSFLYFRSKWIRLSFSYFRSKYLPDDELSFAHVLSMRTPVFTWPLRCRILLPVPCGEMLPSSDCVHVFAVRKSKCSWYLAKDCNRSKRKSYKQIMDSCKTICTFKWIFIYDSTVDLS